MIEDRDIELVETLLDGQLAAKERQALHDRLETEPELRIALERLRSERLVRAEAFASFEPDEISAERAADRALSMARVRHHRGFGWKAARYAAAVAACVGGGLLIGFLANPHRVARPNQAGAPSSRHSAVVYNVAITDENGRLLGVQKFDDLDRAKEFSEDLQRDQDRLERLRHGQVAIRSAQF